jgi:dTDP-N-acetylfucosamine:lipid II N-acetylfucosaminyltransferase
MTKKILHIAGCDKFIPPFIKLVKEKFNFDEHEFLLTTGLAAAELIDAKNISLSNTTFSARLKHYFQTIIKMHQADKVILHGIFDIRLVQILFFTPWLLHKCHWVIWGGDLYTYQLGYKNRKWKIKEFYRRPVIKNIGHLVTYIEGDVALARKWYKAKGEYHECLMYTSNLYKEYSVQKNRSKTISIQVGNSASPSNNHLEVLKKLLPYKDKNICIYLPLSYGSQEYAKQVIEHGREWFGDKFKPLIDMLPFNEYLAFLGTIDIAIFNHNRQQAMGNIITLLGLGKTVYIRSDTTQWQFFKDIGIEIRDVELLSTLESQNLNENISRIKAYFSQDNYLKQLESLFN